MSGLNGIGAILEVAALMVDLMAKGSGESPTTGDARLPANSPSVENSSAKTIAPQASAVQPSLSTSRVTPKASLIFEGVEYTFGGYHSVAPSESTGFVVDGTDVNVSDLEVAGTTNKGHAPGINQGQQVYRSRTGDADAVYTFTSGQSNG